MNSSFISKYRRVLEKTLENSRIEIHNKRMKLIPIFLAVLLWQCIGLAGDTAYQALRVLGRERPNIGLARVIEVDGLDGSPQPAVWKIVLDDPSARGGIREFEVSNDKVTSEKTPVHAYSGSSEGGVMDFKKLNIDSSAAFVIANNEAIAAKVGFDHVDYLLRCGDTNPAPVWILTLLNDKKQKVGSFEILADSAVVVRREGLGASAVEPPKGSGLDESGQKAGMGKKVKESLIHGGASVEEFFTGHRTLEKTLGD